MRTLNGNPGAWILAALLAACGGDPRAATARNDTGSRAAANAGTRAADTSAIPSTPLGASIRRGRAILLATHDSLPENVGNGLRCVSCHLDEGRRPYAMPWTGVYARFPQFRSRSATINALEDRINDCFERSLAGKALDLHSPAMHDMVAYMAWLSKGIPVGSRVAGQGIDSLRSTGGDTVRGAAVWVQQCARCHGENGQGQTIYPAVWGQRSFSIGAGMARPRTSSAFIRRNMPFDQPGTLSEQQANDVASFVSTRPRPDYAPKSNDWPRGDPPADLPYKTNAGRKK